MLSQGAGLRIVGARAMVVRKWGAVTELEAVDYRRQGTPQKPGGLVLTEFDMLAAESILAHKHVGLAEYGKVVGEVDVVVPVAMERGTSRDWKLPLPGIHFAEACEELDSSVLEELVLPRTLVRKAGRMHADRLLMVALMGAHT